MSFVRVADPDRDGDYLVIDKETFDPAIHTLIGAAVHPTDPPPQKVDPVVAARPALIRVRDPKHPDDYLLIAPQDFRADVHERIDEPVTEALVPEPPPASTEGTDLVLKSLSAPEAIELVSSLAVVPTLQTLRRTETRVTVLKAIDARITALGGQ